ncbi:MAG: type II toxin-antitoxin system VapC family toxin [Burkholderiaceae bacterium]
MVSTIVVDASVALKWVFDEPRGERDAAAARQLLRGVRDGQLKMLVPIHFLAEVAGVLAREWPAGAAREVVDLMRVDMEVVDDPGVMLRAVDLAISHRQHVLDTLYHAIALERDDAWLVTADERYWRAARAAGRIVRLAEFSTLH